MPLTATKCKFAQPGPHGRPKRYNDRDGLFLLVLERNGTIRRRWRYAFTFGGKRSAVTVGVYPSVSLVAARAKHATLKKKLDEEGVNPATVRHQQKLDERARFDVVAKKWLAAKKPTWADRTYNGKKYRVENYMLKTLGGFPIAQITTRHISHVVNALQVERGNVHLVHRVQFEASQIMRWAAQEGYLKHDTVTPALRGSRDKYDENHRARLEDAGDVGGLLADIDALAAAENKRVRTTAQVLACSQIMPYVFVRSNELRGARWSEFDFDTATWTIPAERMKQTRGGKRPEHIVPLASQVVALLRALRPHVGTSPFVFPAPKGFGNRSKRGYVSEGALLSALDRMGYARAMTIHGWRGVAGTMLRDVLKFPWDVIQVQLSHKFRDKTRAAYEAAKFLDERVPMMQRWADHLDGLRAAALARRRVHVSAA